MLKGSPQHARRLTLVHGVTPTTSGSKPSASHVATVSELKTPIQSVLSSTGPSTRLKEDAALSASGLLVPDASYRSITTTLAVMALGVVASAFAAFFVGRVIGTFLGTCATRLTLYNERSIIWPHPPPGEC